MDIIALERWKPSAEDPRKLEYAGQPAAQQVFEELKQRLEGMGYLPDEYFELRSEWENGREIPKDADLFCTVDYGESEGIYVDVYLKWYDQEQKKSVTSSFIVGKTLGENGNDMDRMFLTASAITKAVHGDHATYARYMMVNGQEDTGGAVVHLSMKEQQAIINALVEQRERQLGDVNQTEQLLRRMTGS
ncbi:MAG: ankyrin repeat domain-containing protein, partial [Oscillospiraceae bacterium]|nr:ankyrin repeat domain-containing protein [Oscillospiraceae bacterium]